MNPQPTPTDIQQVRQSLARVLRDDQGDEATAPIRAGRRARAVADACRKLGLAVILIDRTGRVLHASAAATAMLGDGLSLAAGHLVGSSRAFNQAVQQAVTAAVSEDGDDHHAGTRTGGTVIVTGLPYRDVSPLQLLRGVLLLARRGERSGAALTSLRMLLAS